MRSRSLVKILKHVSYVALVFSMKSAIAAEGKTCHTFIGNRWSDTPGRTVGTFVLADDATAGMHANVMMQDFRTTPSWSVNFFVKENDLLVFDYNVFKVEKITLDAAGRARVKTALEKGKRLPPGGADIRDKVSVCRVDERRFSEGQIILPRKPSKLNFFVDGGGE